MYKHGGRVKFPGGGAYMRRFPAGRRMPVMNWSRGGYQQFGNPANNYYSPKQLPGKPNWVGKYYMPKGWSVMNGSPEIIPQTVNESRNALTWLENTANERNSGVPYGGLALLALRSLANKSPYAVLGYGALNSKEPMGYMDLESLHNYYSKEPGYNRDSLDKFLTTSALKQGVIRKLSKIVM